MCGALEPSLDQDPREAAAVAELCRAGLLMLVEREGVERWVCLPSKPALEVPAVSLAVQFPASVPSSPM